MTRPELIDALCAVLAQDQTELPLSAQRMAKAIEDRHGAAVVAMVFYGSGLRESDDPAKMLDFYVIVRDYKSVYPNPLLRFATWLLPPGVHHLQFADEDGHELRSKYAVVSERAFLRRTGSGLESMLWARFVQPAIIRASTDSVQNKLLGAFANACIQFYQQSAPLAESHDDPHAVWIAGLAASYKTELRPESPLERSKEIVARYPDRYTQLSEVLAKAIGEEPDTLGRAVCRAKWGLRRILGKPRGAARVLKAALTFDGGLDYVLEKVRSHSGVQLDVSERAKRHPIIFAPVIAWRLYRAGAFR